MFCLACGNKLIWGNDFDLEENTLGVDSEIISSYSCPTCDTSYDVCEDDEKVITISFKEN